jgi:capsular exopolysaccharide synthesis family protein
MNDLRMNDEHRSVQLREYLTILSVRKWWIVMATVIVVGSALLFSFQQPPVFVSEAEVYVKSVTLVGTDEAVDEALNMDTQARLAEAPGVGLLAADELGLPAEEAARLMSNLEVSTEPDTEILTFQYTHKKGKTAARRAQALANAYLEYRQQSIGQGLTAREAQVRGEIAALQGRLAETTNLLIREDLQAQILLAQNELTSLNVQQAESLDVGEVFQPAQIPLSQASPDHFKTGLLGLIAGLPLGVALAFLRERFDDRLRGRTDLETHAGAAVLAVVPRMPNWKNAGESPVVTLVEPKSAAAEAYRTLRTSVLFAAAQRGMSTLMISSANAQEGKTSTTANLGVALAQSGKRVILVSADLRKPRLHRFFRSQNGTGITNVLAGEKSALEVLSWVGVENLRLLPSGPVPGNPAELLGSDAMENLLAELQEAADFVLIDAAPVLPVADAMTLTPLTDAVLFVADARRTTRGAIEQARHQLDQVNARVIGTVLNNFDPSKAPGDAYQHYGYYAYRVDEPAERRSGVMSWGSRRN